MNGSSNAFARNLRNEERATDARFGLHSAPVSSLASIAILPFVAAAVTPSTLVAPPSAPEDGCPNARQVGDALRTRLPEATASVDPQLWPPQREVLRSMLDVAPDGTMLRFSLLDSRGELQLRRSLPTAGHGKPGECLALAETIAAIVERFLDFDASTLPSDAANEVGPVPPGSSRLSERADNHPPHGWGLQSLFIGVEGLPVSSPVIDTLEGHVGARISLGSGPLRWVAIGSGGVARTRDATLASSVASLSRYPLRLGVAAQLPVGLGWVEPTVLLGVDVVIVTNSGDSTLDKTYRRPLPNLSAGVGYRHGIGDRLFARIIAGGGVALMRYRVVLQGSNDELLSTPRAYLFVGIDAGVVFR